MPRLGGLTRRLRREWWGCRPEWGSTFFRSERKYQRKHAARRLRRRPTARSDVGFGLREPNGWTPRIYSGRPIPAVRPEQSDHVPWADCPQGLSSTLVRFAHPSGKKAPIAHFGGGARNVARNEVGQLPPALGARSCSPFSAVKIGGPFSLRCLSPLCFAAGDAGQTQTAMLGMLRCDRDDSTARKNRLDFYSVVGINRTQIMSVWIFRHVLEFPETQKASGVSNPRWLFMRAMRPIAERRSFLFN